MGLATSCGSKGKKVEKETAAPADEGWTILFDGTSTAGWRGYDTTAFPSKGWEVVDGTLHCIGSGAGEAGGAGGGDIIYDKKFSNFELSLEWKLSEGGNSGIFILASGNSWGYQSINHLLKCKFWTMISISMLNVR